MQWFNNVLSEDEANYVISQTLCNNKWNFSGYSTTNDSGYTFWNMNLIEDAFFTETFLKKIEELTDKKFEIERVYANGQTYGLPGNIHSDIDEDTYASELYYTFVYYVNPLWDLNWGGQTIIINEDGTVDSVLFNPNAAIIFPSILKHFGSEPTRQCKDLRVTVAFKLKEIV